MDTVFSTTPQTFHLKYRRLLTALVLGLLLRVLDLAQDGVLDTLSLERRIMLVLVALRLLIMVHSNFTIPETRKPGYTDWRAGIPSFFFVIPLLIAFWSAAWATGGQLGSITSYALAASLILLLVSVSFVVRLWEAAKRDAAAVHRPYPAPQFWIDLVFYGAYGVIVAIGTIGLAALSPGVLADTVAIGGLALNVYLMTWVVQGIFWFFSNLLREAAKETGGAQ